MSRENLAQYHPESRDEAREFIKSFKGAARSLRNGLAAILRDWRRGQMSQA